MAAIHTWKECIPLSAQLAQTECSSQVECIELFIILIRNATFLVSVAKMINNFAGYFFSAAHSLTLLSHLEFTFAKQDNHLYH